MIASIVGYILDSAGADPRTVQTIEIPAGETGDIAITVSHRNGTAFNLSGGQLLFTVEQGNAVVISRQATITAPTSGLAHIPLVVADTLTLAGSAQYDVWYTDASGNRYQAVLSSTFVIGPAEGQPGQPVTVPPAQQPLAQGPAGPPGPTGPAGPPGPGGVVPTRVIATGVGLLGGGDLSVDRTHTIDQGFSPTWSGIHTYSNYQDIADINTPSAPASGFVRLYAGSRATGLDSFGYRTSAGNEIVIGREVLVGVRNITGATIVKGSVVYISGSAVGLPRIDLARADSGMTKLPALGIAPQDIANNANGYIMRSGVLSNLNTAAWTAGDTLYVDPVTAGAITNVEPVHPLVVQAIGTVETTSATLGSIMVAVVPINLNAMDGVNGIAFAIGPGTGSTARSLLFKNSSTGTLSWNPTAARTLTLPDATDTLIGAGGTNTFSGVNTFSAGIKTPSVDTASAGVLTVGGVAATTVQVGGAASTSVSFQISGAAKWGISGIGTFFPQTDNVLSFGSNTLRINSGYFSAIRSGDTAASDTTGTTLTLIGQGGGPANVGTAGAGAQIVAAGGAGGSGSVSFAGGVGGIGQVQGGTGGVSSGAAAGNGGIGRILGGNGGAGSGANAGGGGGAANSTGGSGGAGTASALGGSGGGSTFNGGAGGTDGGFGGGAGGTFNINGGAGANSAGGTGGGGGVVTFVGGAGGAAQNGSNGTSGGAPTTAGSAGAMVVRGGVGSIGGNGGTGTSGAGAAGGAGLVSGGLQLNTGNGGAGGAGGSTSAGGNAGNGGAGGATGALNIGGNTSTSNGGAGGIGGTASGGGTNGAGGAGGAAPVIGIGSAVGGIGGAGGGAGANGGNGGTGSTLTVVLGGGAAGGQAGGVGGTGGAGGTGGTITITAGPGGAGGAANGGTAGVGGVGGNLLLTAGNGGTNSGNGSNGAGSLALTGGLGAAANGASSATSGGVINIVTGAGGAGSATVVGQNGGTLTLGTGSGGVTGGAGAGVPGSINFNQGGATTLQLSNDLATLQFLATGPTTKLLRVGTSPVDTVGMVMSLRGGQGGAYSASVSGAGGNATVIGGLAGAGDATHAASAGGAAILQGGGGGTNAGGGGGVGGNAQILGGAGSAASGASVGQAGGLGLVQGGSGGAGSATGAAGAGQQAQLIGGTAGADGGGGGANGGTALIRGGPASGAGAAGSVTIGDVNTSVVQIGATTTNTQIQGALLTAQAFRPHRITVADVPYTTLVSDCIIAYTSISAPRVITAAVVGNAANPILMIIKDESGGASVTNTITLTPASGLIDGAASKVIVNSAYGAARLYCNGTNFFTV